MDDNDARQPYGAELFTRDIVSVIEDAKMAPAALIGHSFGALESCAPAPIFSGPNRFFASTWRIIRSSRCMMVGDGNSTLPVVSEPDGTAVLARIRVPVHCVCGESSAVISVERATRIRAALPKGYGRGPLILPRTHHHMMLGQPLLLIRTSQALLQEPV
jgi:pimeloyl-ACP methyl ester carboxylesterase